MDGLTKLEFRIFNVMRNFSVAVNKLCYIIIMLISCGVCSGQNLVPNGSFESHSNCPVFQGEIYKAIPWQSATFAGTPDYYDSCSLAFNVPYGSYGIQYAIDGNAYAGEYAFVLSSVGPNLREYIQAALIDSLLLNHVYQVSFFVSLGDDLDYAVNKMGAYLSDTAIYGTDTSYLPFIPQIESTSFLSDTANWLQISGFYTAHGGERYITIGNFRSDSLTDTLRVNNFGYPFAYYYIDSVTVIDYTANGIYDINYDETILFPNPFIDKLNITSKGNEQLEVSLYDVTSRKIFNQPLINSTTINTEQLAKGIYLYEVRNRSGIIKKGKVVRE